MLGEIVRIVVIDVYGGLENRCHGSNDIFFGVNVSVRERGWF